MRVGWLLVLLVSGCVTSERERDAESASSAVGQGAGDQASEAEGDGPIGVVAGGLWYRTLGCPSPDPSSCVDEASFWIDLRVRNDAYDKQVGIVWIDRVREDAAAPWHVARASYEGPRDAGFETWGVDVTTGLIGGNEPNPQIQFAAFVTMNGQTYWDNNGGLDHVLE